MAQHSAGTSNGYPSGAASRGSGPVGAAGNSNAHGLETRGERRCGGLEAGLKFKLGGFQATNMGIMWESYRVYLDSSNKLKQSKNEAYGFEATRIQLKGFDGSQPQTSFHDVQEWEDTLFWGHSMVYSLESPKNCRPQIHNRLAPADLRWSALDLLWRDSDRMRL